MSGMRRIYNLVLGLGMLVCALVLIVGVPGDLDFVSKMLGVMLVFQGLRLLVYFFAMARHMVGGLWVLLGSIILLELAMFTSVLDTYPRVYVILYLLGYHALSGGVNLLRGLEARRYQSPEWKPNVLHGLINIGMTLICLCFVHSGRVLTMAYGVTLAWAALLRIVSAFRRTAVIYIGP